MANKKLLILTIVTALLASNCLVGMERNIDWKNVNWARLGNLNELGLGYTNITTEELKRLFSNTGTTWTKSEEESEEERPVGVGEEEPEEEEKEYDHSDLYDVD